ncbi:hypothetical protein GCM10027406_33940 [Leifsonia lichenia]
MLVFVIVGGAALTLLLISMLFGELLSLLDGALSGTALGVGGTFFGASGVIVVANGLPSWVAYVSAAVLGLVSLVIVQLLVARFRSTEDVVPTDPSGLYGVARTRITPTSGEVSLSGPHEVETRMAFADAEITAGASIRVVASHGARVKVEHA